MADLPTGTVTCLFTDIEGSTALWEQHPDAARVALARHDALLEGIVADHGGTVVRPRGEGDSRFAVFARATDAVTAAAALQQALAAEPWPTPTPLQVRIALHTGEADLREGDYYGTVVNRCARLRAVAHGGQTLLSQATYDLVCDHPLGDVGFRDLGVHRLKDLQRPEHIFQLVVPGLPADFPPLVTLEARPTNLPPQPTPFIGREREVTALVHRLRDPAVRLLTLTGPGGIGKTRLALQVAAELLDAFPDGVWFVDLAPLRDPALVATTIATTLGIQESGGQPLVDRLHAYLAAKHLLLVLDNFEQVLAAAPLVGDLPKAAPHLTVLVTSRMVLGLYGEHDFQVPSLALPALKDLPALECLTQYEAVRLFIERAQAAKPDFQVTNANAPAVAEICYRLDGLPLAIELAAARIKLLPPPLLLARLTQRLQVLTGGARDLPPRQQTLRRTIDWSYNLLDVGEQQLFRRLGVFVGGCTLEAVEVVCNATGDLELDLLDGLQSLLDKSLLRQVEGPDGEPRFTMLETIREYAVERVVESGEVGALRQQHATYFLALTKAAERQIDSAERAVGLNRLEQEHDNVRAALSWSLVEGDRPATALELAGAMSGFWIARGVWGEGRNWLERVLGRAEASGRSEARVRALLPAGVLALFQGDLGAARARLEESLALARDLGDKRLIASALTFLAMLARSQGNLLEARSLLEANVALSREGGNRRGLAFVLSRLGPVVGDQGDYAAARSILEEALSIWHDLGDRWGRALALLALGPILKAQGESATAQAVLEEALAISRELADTSFIADALAELAHTARVQRNFTRANALLEENLVLGRELGDRRRVAHALNTLGDVARGQGDYSRARVRYEESLCVFQELGDQMGIGGVLHNLGYVALAQGDSACATTRFVESLRLFQAAGNRWSIADCLVGLAGVSIGAADQAGERSAHLQRAARLLGVAEALHGTGARRDLVGEPANWLEWDRIVAAVRTQLGASTFEAAWAEGKTMSLEQAIAYALESEDTVDGVGHAGHDVPTEARPAGVGPS